MQIGEIKDFLKDEKIRVKKLYAAKHKQGFKTKENFVKWYINKVKRQNYKCFYCETSIFDINKLIDSQKLKTRKIGHGKRGTVLEIDKKINEKDYIPDNCVLSCYYCNNDKSYIFDSKDYKENFGKNRNKYFSKLLNRLKKNDSAKRIMPKGYIYRMDHDTGFAPNVKYGICTLSGCKRSTIELWAKRGHWVIGLGGNKTNKPNKIIYAMEVEKNLSYDQFKKKYSRKSKYLSKKDAGKNVLVSRKFYYFGNKAIDLPKSLTHLIINRQGCKGLTDKDIFKLKKIFKNKYNYGELEIPNNPRKCVKTKKCSKKTSVNSVC